LFHGFSAPLCTCVRGVTASRNRECYFAVHVHMSTSHDVLVERFRYTLYNWSKNRRSWSVPERSKKTAQNLLPDNRELYRFYRKTSVKVATQFFNSIYCFLVTLWLLSRERENSPRRNSVS